MAHAATDFVPLNIAVLTVSDTRTLETDTSGQYLCDALRETGHLLADRAIVIDDIYQIRAQISAWIASDTVQAIVVTGGTGFTARDSTPEAVRVLFDKEVEGFGELFRHFSLSEIGTSTLQSRALAGYANNTLIACLPGSTNACRTGWTKVLQGQLDARTKPCNFVPHLRAKLERCQSRG